MKTDFPVKALLLDIGGVFLTNGWGRQSRQLAAEKFSLDFEEMNDRHKIAFDAYETGKITLDEYLQLILFYKQRSFTKQAFKEFMFTQSQPVQPMIDWICQIKERYGIKVAAVNNEGRELNDYRIKTFQLDRFIDVFISSCFVHLRKPDKDIYTLALDVLLITPEEALYVDDRAIFIEVAEGIGINAVHHTSLETTMQRFAEFGFSTP